MSQAHVQRVRQKAAEQPLDSLKRKKTADTMKQTDTMAHESRKVFFDIFAKHVNMGRNNKPFTQLRPHDGES